ncbi:hypothetical protein C8R32_10630 [Nitrosospira sp. Nsp5]|uniref:Short chain amide porin n=1 Tax=Nitrosospira multiformis TaxID=1231 RepID=A0ABY0T8R6_9PROT|nr:MULTISPECIES: hypothetical protein [Nitrosospira]PTR07956.1 hypothetical protein C8R32_10630 [Nitrosospira sp. Nsp5]SDQ45296.1 hypothetical protein SAMN05216402_0906 [Nitrosospira multiformis]
MKPSLTLTFLSCCVFSTSLYAQAIDLYVDTKTKQIYSEPGAGRVRMGSFEKVPDTPAKPPSSADSGQAPATGKDAGVAQAPQGAPVSATPADKSKGVVAETAKGGFGFADWKEKDPFKWNLNGDGSQYLKFGFLNQVQLRYEQNNPGSLIQGQPVDDSTDIGLRRTRLVLQGQITDRVYFYTQYGMNNFNFLSQMNGNRHIEAYFHDAFGELRLTEGHQMVFGGGLGMFNGLTRFSAPSVSTIMTMDVPVGLQYTTERTSLFNRQLGVYLRGQISKFRYIVAANDSFPITTDGITNDGAISPTVSNFAQVGHKKNFTGMFYWNFWETEPNTNPYMQGTYLGKKSILNLEAGFATQKDAMWTGTSAADARFHDMTHWSVAGYLDAPVDKVRETAISAYIGYTSLNYGPNYLRMNGNGQNSANGVGPGGSLNGAGNTFPMFGTGDLWYAQIGYLLPIDWLGGKNGQLQPYASITSANWEALRDQMNVFNLGLNWLIKGHNSKVTFDWQNRPIFNTAGNTIANRNQFVLQYQIAF